jgi:hypothetical protein
MSEAKGSGNPGEMADKICVKKARKLTLIIV